MLAVMLFNGYIFISVVFGAFVGYFLFGHLSMKTNMENLQAIQTKIICSARCADSGKCQTLKQLPICSVSFKFSFQIFTLQEQRVLKMLVHVPMTFAIIISNWLMACESLIISGFLMKKT